MDLLRSIRNCERSYVRFINATDKVIEIIWINFVGNYIVYELLNRGCYIDIDTYKNHPWIARNSVTKDRLHIDKKFVYNPKTSIELFQERFPDKKLPEEFAVRIRAKITLPVYSLRYRTLLAIRDIIQNENDVEKLELPKELQQDLKKSIIDKNNQFLIPVERSNR